MAGEYQNAADAAAFKEILARDPECKRCFECNYPNAPWCDINHGIFVCLDCSGVHRGLGVHLSFVRSSTMDGWSDWRPEKLRQMQVGGNAKARKFFEAKGVPKSPIRERYSHVGALMYKDKLEAEAAGRPFNEGAWQPPDWAVPQPQQQQQQARTMGGNGSSASGAANANRFQGIGSNSSGNQRGGQQQRSGGAAAEDDWLATLSSGLSSVAETATRAASTAATATAASTRTLASRVQETTRSVHSDDISKKASETAAATAAVVSSAWGALSAWTSSAVAQLTSDGDAKQRSGGANDDEDGLSALTRNLTREQQQQQAAADAERFRGVEHQAEPDPAGLSEIARNLPRTNRYEGIGSSPTAAAPARPAAAAPAARVSPVAATAGRSPMNRTATSPPPGQATAGGMGSRQVSAASVGSASPASAARLAATRCSPPDSKPPAEKKKTAGVPDEWGWDDES